MRFIETDADLSSAFLFSLARASKVFRSYLLKALENSYCDFKYSIDFKGLKTSVSSFI